MYFLTPPLLPGACVGLFDSSDILVHYNSISVPHPPQCQYSVLHWYKQAAVFKHLKPTAFPPSCLAATLSPASSPTWYLLTSSVIDARSVVLCSLRGVWVLLFSLSKAHEGLEGPALPASCFSLVHVAGGPALCVCRAENPTKEPYVQMCLCLCSSYLTFWNCFHSISRGTVGMGL